MRRSFRTTTALLSIALLAASLFAGGPLDLNPNDPDGVSRWPNGGLDIPFNMDLGGLGPLNDADAQQFILDALQIWEDVPTATQTYSNNGNMPFDVDENNFAPFAIPILFGINATPDGLSPVVFDEDGAIFDAIFGIGTGVLGFASADTFAPDGTPLEAVCFLNGGAVLDGFPLVDFFGVTVHEFGHYSGLAHTVVNGESVLLGDDTGPSPQDTFGPAPLTSVETMYPFALVGQDAASLHADDIGMISYLYPEAGYLSTAGFLRGSMELPANAGPVTGVNIIARNVADPFNDAVSSISGDQGDTGVFTLRGLTPGADYVIFIDDIQAGGFSTPPLINFPGPEEFYNGADESDNITSPDNPLDSVLVSPSGGLETGFDVIFNAFTPGDILPVGDDGNVEIFLPFPFTICDSQFNSVFVNANGNLTFGVPSGDFSESAADMTGGPPRIAGLWDDLNPSAGGTVTFDIQDTGGAQRVIVMWDDVPEFISTGSNTFSITVANDDKATAEYGSLTATDGLAGISCGSELASGLEPQIDVSAAGGFIKLKQEAAVFELFNAGNPNDLSGDTLHYDAKTQFKDSFEPNNVPFLATNSSLPFNTLDARTRFSDIAAGGDVDFYRFSAQAGTTIIAEVIAGNLDSTLGLFSLSGGVATLVDSDDDGGAGLLSRIIFPVAASGDFALAVSTFPDLDFNGDGSSSGRYVLDAFAINGFLLDLGDDDSEEVTLNFNFPFQGGSFPSVFVNSNGSLTFGGGDNDFSESVSEFLNELPRIAMLWDDLSPNQGGLVLVDSAATSATVSFQGVPQFLTGDSNNFSVTLNDDGSIAIDYGAVNASDGLVGVTEGGGAADPGETDLSAAGPLSATGTTYELFTIGTFDLAMQSLTFLP
ncbi:MAG TPA: hypothetical protein VLV83_21940 [Acidobacteriota bacterium]|nr:hypothetical protein [Acidobacteriota bacterium]